MLMFNSKKSQVEIILGVLAVAIVFGGALYFFFIFKAHATLEARDEYIWNKVQEVPLALFSMDIENESFVSKLNKIYYSFPGMSKDDFTNKIKNITSDQLFYFTGKENRPYGFLISISDMSILELPAEFSGSTDCKCQVAESTGPYSFNYRCNSDCGVDKDGDLCGYQVFTYINKDDTYCYDLKAKYESEYPIPLTFNGTDVLISTIFYKVVEYHV